MSELKDWNGNAFFLKSTNTRSREVASHDYYATDPFAVELLLSQEAFSQDIWEPACGEGHISEQLKKYGYRVHSTDLIDRGYGMGGIDFLKEKDGFEFHGDIITNPPYKYAKQFVEKAMDVLRDGGKLAMFLKLLFLEGNSRRDLFKKHPPSTVYVSSDRLKCGKNGVFSEDRSAVAYCWIVWEKGYVGPTILKWIN